MLLLAAMLRLAALRWLGVCVILLTPLSAANLASAHELEQTKTRVGGFESAAPLDIWLNGSATERSYSGNLRCEPGVASESLLAARGGLGKSISEGHAFGKHVLKKGEFKDLGITTREGFAKHIDDVVVRAKGADVRQLSGGRTAYWDQASGTTVIRNPSAPDMGTAFRPTAGRTYFETLK